MELRDKLVKTIECAIKSDVVGITLTEMDISGVAYRVADVLEEAVERYKAECERILFEVQR